MNARTKGVPICNIAFRKDPSGLQLPSDPNLYYFGISGERFRRSSSFLAQCLLNAGLPQLIIAQSFDIGDHRFWQASNSY